MSSDWSGCKKILCIRPDNMGDLIMSSPALRALKKTFGCSITVLTSSMAGGIATYRDEVDEVITVDLPWVKNNTDFNAASFSEITEEIRIMRFDAAVIFTVYSQNSLPSAMIAFMAGIPLRLAYCRENPYALLTNWFPDKEPYTIIRHQVQRDLELVAMVGAVTDDNKLKLKVDESKWVTLQHKIQCLGVDTSKPWMILHPGVSEIKREFPASQWIEIAKKIVKDLGCQVLFTGGSNEIILVTGLVTQSGSGAYSLAGILSLEEFILLIKRSPLVLSVNTATIHIAAATSTPVIVLYALTNPQHTPWKATGKVFLCKVKTNLQSSNEVISYVNKTMEEYKIEDINLKEILSAVGELLSASYNADGFVIPELIQLPVYG